jgi:hypothetical protein
LLIILHGYGIAAAEKPSPSPLRVEIDFPGGSADVESIDQEKRLIRLKPSDHPDRGWRCWWYVKVTGIRPGETISLDVGDAPWTTPRQAAFSIDNETWIQTAPGKRQGKRILYQQRVDAEQAWFAWGPPFVPADAEQLVRWADKQSPHAEAFELCRTRGGRPVPALRVEAAGTENAERHGIWIQARQHAWESGASWVCRGFVEWLVSDDPRAAALREQSRITIVPIMDIDNVAIGAGGKNQKPQDHNRDWSDDPHWYSVAAAMEGIKRQREAGGFDLFIDLHNPDAGAKNPYFYIPPRKLLGELGNRNLDHFLAAARREITGPLAFRGDVRESGSDYDKAWRRMSKNWVVFNTDEHVVAVTLETAWNTPHSTTEGYRAVGRQLGQAIARYFRVAPSDATEK